MKGPAFRQLLKCSARATNSLPVPVSPLIKTVTSVSLIRSISARTLRIAPLAPIMSSAGRSVPAAAGRGNARSRKTRSTTKRISSTSKGLVR